MEGQGKAAAKTVGGQCKVVTKAVEGQGNAMSKPTMLRSISAGEWQDQEKSRKVCALCESQRIAGLFTALTIGSESSAASSSLLPDEQTVRKTVKGQ